MEKEQKCCECGVQIDISNGLVFHGDVCSPGESEKLVGDDTLLSHRAFCVSCLLERIPLEFQWSVLSQLKMEPPSYFHEITKNSVQAITVRAVHGIAQRIDAWIDISSDNVWETLPLSDQIEHALVASELYLSMDTPKILLEYVASPMGQGSVIPACSLILDYLMNIQQWDMH